MRRSLSLRLFAALVLLSGSGALASDPHGHAEGVSPKDALVRLREGNQRFVAGETRHPEQDVHHREVVAGGQHPFAIVVTCADSRLPPELIFDQGLGGLFVVREAGNQVDANGVASIEYAIEHLGAKLVVVMGHTSCGAVKAALGAKPGESAGSPSLDALVASVNHCMAPETLSDTAKADPKVVAASTQNVRGVVAHLSELSPIVREKVASGEVEVYGALYDLSTGLVDLWATGGASAPAPEPLAHPAHPAPAAEAPSAPPAPAAPAHAKNSTHAH